MARPDWMEPSAQLLSHARVECSIGWHSRALGWMETARSVPAIVFDHVC